ncbi:BspA family leucine-rich repeat surface protein [Flagellimonas sp. S174]|uniref:BspA family leucine-rich repeat surface protein n=1 Tax=Flagellimonas sp. S174 TaxID=3410790 RepID=UPI003BF5D200
MKTLRFFTLMILTVGLFLGSCSNDDNGNTPPVADNSDPEITNQTATATIAEDADGTATIFTVTATDGDSDTLEFSISTNSGGLFAINKDNGQITLADGQALDFETSPEHTITVTVSDGNGGTDTINITITVTDVEIAPTIGLAIFEVPEDALEIGNINASGEDGNTLVYEITVNDAIEGKDLFVIDSDTGIIGLAEGQSLDFETTEQHTITVTVTDGELVTEQDITITVQNVIEDLFEDPASFIFTIDTALEPGIPFRMQAFGETISLQVDWGDGSEEETVEGQDTTTPARNYVDQGIYTVAIKGAMDRLSFYIDNDLDEELMLLSVQQWGTNPWKSMENMFRNAENFTGFGNQEIPAPNLSQCVSMDRMFQRTLVFENTMGMGNWDVSSVTSMEGMFDKADLFNEDIGQWNVSNVTNMRSMFFGADTFNRDLNQWNVANVTTMRDMFNSADLFNGNISEWNTEKVTTMFQMFFAAGSFDQNLSGWDIGSMTTMFNMLSNSGMSPQNYANALIGWNNAEDVPEGIILGASNIQYCDAADDARNELIFGLGKGWTITDGGEIVCFGFVPPNP